MHLKQNILVDFSKVVSPIGISRFIASNISEYVNLPFDEIRNLYKKNITNLVVGKFPIKNFIEELFSYAKQGISLDFFTQQILELPKLDPLFLEFLLSLKKEYDLYLVSDIFPELGAVVKKGLYNYFDKFVFSFELGAKKSESLFREKLSQEIDLQQSVLFIDDKKENLLLAQKYGIAGVEYRSLVEDQETILNKLGYPLDPNR